MLNSKLIKSQRELFDNLKAFLYTKVKNFTPIQDVNDMALILNTQDKILKCHNIEQLKQLCHILYNQGIKHTIMMQGLFLFFDYFKDNLKLRSFRMLSEEQVINFLFELAQNRKPSSMAKYVMYLRQFFDYLDRKKHYSSRRTKLLYFNSRQREKRKKGLYQKEFVRTKLECLA